MAAWREKRAEPNRCPYCGAPCKGATCGSHADLARIEAAKERDKC